MSKRGLLTFLIGFGLVILVIILVVKAFTGAGKKAVITERTPITSYVDTSTAMEFSASGPIVAQEDYDSIRISVGRDERRIDILRGYEGEIVATRTYENTEAAYNEFLHALALNGYAVGEPSENTSEEVAGRCASGSRYIFAVKDGNREIESRWTTSCGKLDADLFSGSKRK